MKLKREEIQHIADLARLDLTDEELEKYLQIYATSTEMAKQYSDKWELSHPVKTRAIAPVGTIGIVAETTTGIEPVFCLAYKRRYKKGPELTEYQYILDPTAKRLIEKNNLDPDSIEDAYDLSKNVERRIEKRLLSVGNGIGPAIFAPILFTVSRI